MAKKTVNYSSTDLMDRASSPTENETRTSELLETKSKRINTSCEPQEGSSQVTGYFIDVLMVRPSVFIRF